jgi:hypothetical protein
VFVIYARAVRTVSSEWTREREAGTLGQGGRMKAMVWMVATTIGGAAGWWLGAFIGIFTAVSLSAVGSGIALFYAQRLANEYLP